MFDFSLGLLSNSKRISSDTRSSSIGFIKRKRFLGRVINALRITFYNSNVRFTVKTSWTAALDWNYFNLGRSSNGR